MERKDPQRFGRVRDRYIEQETDAVIGSFFPFCQHGLRHPQSLPSLKGETDQVDSDDHANHADAART